VKPFNKLGLFGGTLGWLITQSGITVLTTMPVIQTKSVLVRRTKNDKEKLYNFVKQKD
jgi:hypothetical protein